MRAVAASSRAGRPLPSRRMGLAPVLAAAMLALPAGAADLSEVASFDGIEDEAERSAMIFNEMARVITHPRCMNCHPRDDMPRQGMAMEAHQPPVVRGGEGGMGVSAMLCTTCHISRNVTYAAGGGSMPGHEPWHLAPIEQGWIGLSVGEICEALKDPATNGDRTLEEIHEHNAHDGLVGWGWDPGEGREPVPGTQEQFGALTRAWIDTGAHCPS